MKRHKPQRTYAFNRMSIEEARKQGYREYFGPVAAISEEWMLANAIQDIIKNKRDAYTVCSVGGYRDVLMIRPNVHATNLYRELEPEIDEKKTSAQG